MSSATKIWICWDLSTVQSTSVPPSTPFFSRQLLSAPPSTGYTTSGQDSLAFVTKFSKCCEHQLLGWLLTYVRIMPIVTLPNDFSNKIPFWITVGTCWNCNNKSFDDFPQHQIPTVVESSPFTHHPVPRSFHPLSLRSSLARSSFGSSLT